VRRVPPVPHGRTRGSIGANDPRGGLSSIGRASDCGSEGYGFKPRRPPHHSEHESHNSGATPPEAGWCSPSSTKKPSSRAGHQNARRVVWRVATDARNRQERSRTAEVVMVPSAAVEADRHGSISSEPTAANTAGADRQIIGTDTRDHPRFRLPIPDDVAVRDATRSAKAVHCDFLPGHRKKLQGPKVLSAVPERIRSSTDLGTDCKIRVRSSGDPRGDALLQRDQCLAPRRDGERRASPPIAVASLLDRVPWGASACHSASNDVVP
jgi:hypothetical protein